MSIIDQNIAVGSTEVARVVATGEVQPLEDLHDIEAIVYVVKDLSKQIDSLKELKKKRATAVDNAIEKITTRIDFLKSIVFATLKKHKEKKVRFPGVGYVSQRKQRVSYEISDEQKLLEVLQKENEYENIVEEVSGHNIKKHELNKLLGMWSKIDKLPDCVSEQKSDPTVTMTFDDEISDSSKEAEDLDETIKELDFSS